ncbi:kinase-like domain-containing protein [Phaeosphaeria sp. MPI-PUGE-AT-0046c]|nr:kinase-like domain-containing protein [Phaeosphaeria sp. MPI-PUGE-AT-0046c]
MTPCSLPYTADDVSLPASLPTVHEIESATEVFGDTTGRKVVGIGPHFVVKYGVQVEPLEGRTMLFLAQSTQIPIPRVYAIFQNATQKFTYIVMERIDGKSLDLEWPRMDFATKDAVASQLRSVFNELRKLASPGGYCSVDHQGLPDGIFWTSDPSKPFAGPFDSEEELNEAIVLKYTKSGLSKHKAKYYARTFASVFRNHKPTFSHGDFQRKNVLIRDRAARSSGAHPELVIIDWEFAGWYPSYWEYSRAIFACARWEDDWNDWVDKILEPFRNEYAWQEILLGELWS